VTPFPDGDLRDDAFPHRVRQYLMLRRAARSAGAGGWQRYLMAGAMEGLWQVMTEDERAEVLAKIGGPR
jgi:hypothetical protein